MTSKHHPLRFLPLLVPAVLALIAKLLSFNGLYGQDAHEYLRQSRAFFDRLNGMPYVPAGLGDSEFAAGYPLSGALLHGLGVDFPCALQLVSWLSAGLSVFFFDRCLQVLTPGARAESRWVFTGLGLLLAPVFVRAGLTAMSDMLGLAFALAALANGLHVLETGRIGAAATAAFFAGFAFITRFSAAALLPPLLAAVGLYLVENRRWAFALVTFAAGVLALLPYFWLKADVPKGFLEHSLVQGWSVGNYFRASFSDANGAVSYFLPNALYLLFPLAHPAFCLPLPGLLLLAKKTDLHLISKKVLVACLILYLLFLGGIPHQNLRFLLPAYAILLLLLFPAWDRMFAYGLYFFKRLTYAIIGTTLAIQLCGTAWMLAPVLARSHLETTVAAELRNTLPAGATLYAFDLDVSLRSYLPGIRIKNLWERLYPEFEEGSFILFNEQRLRQQWQGRNPILNWDHAKNDYRLQESAVLPDGWTLYEIKGAVK